MHVFAAALLALDTEIVPLDKLLALLKKEKEYASASSEDPRTGSTRRLRRASEVLRRDETLDGTDTSEVRQIRKALVRASNELARSAWGSIDLKPEDQIRDFLTDMILDQPQLARLLDFALRLGECGHNLLAESAMVMAQLDQLRDNAVLVLAASLPKRAGQTLLHVSRAFEMFYSAVC